MATSPTDAMVIDDGSGNVEVVTEAVVAAANPTDTVMQANATFSFAYNGVILQFYFGQDYVITPLLAAALAAANAPIS